MLHTGHFAFVAHSISYTCAQETVKYFVLIQSTSTALTVSFTSICAGFIIVRIILLCY